MLKAQRYELVRACVICFVAILLSLSPEARSDGDADYFRQQVLHRYSEIRDISLKTESITFVKEPGKNGNKTVRPSQVVLGEGNAGEWADMLHDLDKAGFLGANRKPVSSSWMWSGEMMRKRYNLPVGLEGASIQYDSTYPGGETYSLSESFGVKSVKGAELPDLQGKVAPEKVIGELMGFGVASMFSYTGASSWDEMKHRVEDREFEIDPEIVSVDGVDVTTIRLEGVYGGEYTVQISCAPGYDMLPIRSTITGPDGVVSHQYRVEEIGEFEGRWFPRVAIEILYGDAGESKRNVHVVTDVKVNAGLTIEDFTMEFPKGTQVIDARVGQVYLVGAADALVEQVQSFVDTHADELQPTLQAETGSRDSAPRTAVPQKDGGPTRAAGLLQGRQLVIVLAVTLCVVVVGTLFGLGQRRRRAR